MPKYKADWEKSKRMAPDKPRDRSQDGWHCERCRTEASGIDCPMCPKCGELMAFGELMTPERIAAAKRERRRW